MRIQCGNQEIAGVRYKSAVTVYALHVRSTSVERVKVGVRSNLDVSVAEDRVTNSKYLPRH